LQHGLVVWFPLGGRMADDELSARWKDVCEADGLLLLVAEPAWPDAGKR